MKLEEGVFTFEQDRRESPVYRARVLVEKAEYPAFGLDAFGGQTKVPLDMPPIRYLIENTTGRWESRRENNGMTSFYSTSITDAVQFVLRWAGQ